MPTGPRLGEGREAEVFLRPDGTVLKLMRDEADADRVRREAAACRALRRSTGATAPRVLETVEVGRRPGLVMEYIDGASLLMQLERRPLRVLSIATALADAHAAVHELLAPTDLPSVNDQLRERVARATPLTAEQRRFALRLLSSLPSGDRLCHGDFHIGNVMGSLTDPVIIDWGYASRGDPIGDVAQSVLLHRAGAMPPGTSAVFALLARAGRRLLTTRYLSVYRRVRPLDQDAFDRWFVVHVAARLGEPVTEEHTTLLRLFESARRVLR